MAKKTDSDVACKSKKALTPAQQAKKEQNIREAAERLQKLQAKQEFENRLRRDPAFKAQYEAEQQAQKDAEVARQAAELRQREERIQEAANKVFKAHYEHAFIAAAMTGIHKEHLVEWLHGRAATFDRVERFFRTKNYDAPTLAASLVATIKQQLVIATLSDVVHSPMKFNELIRLIA